LKLKQNFDVETKQNLHVIVFWFYSSYIAYVGYTSAVLKKISWRR